MPSIKRTGVKSQEVKTGFEAYDGPTPTQRGFYRSRITRIQYKQFKENDAGVQNTGLVVTGVLEAAKGDPKNHKRFDGFPMTTNIVFGDKDAMITRENNFYAALGVKDEPAILYEAGDITSGVKVTKIGGKDPLGIFVNFDIKQGTYLGESRPEVDSVFKYKEVAMVASDEDEETDEDEDLMEDEETDEDSETDEDEEYNARAEELAALSIPALKKAAKELELAVGGTKDVLIERILEAEFVEEEDDVEVEEEEEEESDVEVEEEEEESDDEGAREEREAELTDMTRNQLKVILREMDESFKAKTSQIDSDLVELILAQEFSGVPF